MALENNCVLCGPFAGRRYRSVPRVTKELLRSCLKSDDGGSGRASCGEWNDGPWVGGGYEDEPGSQGSTQDQCRWESQDRSRSG